MGWRGEAGGGLALGQSPVGRLARHSVGGRALRAMFEGIFELLNDTSKPAEPDSLDDLTRNIQELTFVIEAEMNDLNLSCKRARVQRLDRKIDLTVNNVNQDVRRPS